MLRRPVCDRHDHLGIALVATVGHDRGAVAVPVHSRVVIGPAVIAVTRCGTTNCDGQPGVGIDHDLHVHRVPIVFDEADMRRSWVGTKVPSTMSTVSGPGACLIGARASNGAR